MVFKQSLLVITFSWKSVGLVELGVKVTGMGGKNQGSKIIRPFVLSRLDGREGVTY